MLIRTRYTYQLAQALRNAHDDGVADLRVYPTWTARGTVVVVQRRDGSKLSPTERLEVRALVAAYTVPA